MWVRLSMTSTRKPRCANRAATTAPENPAPTTNICVFMTVSQLHRYIPESCLHSGRAVPDCLASPLGRNDALILRMRQSEQDVGAHRADDRFPARSLCTSNPVL